MRTMLLSCALAAMSCCEQLPDCYVRLTVSEYTNLTSQVSTLWAAHTNMQAKIARMKAKREAHKSAVQQVKDNAAKRKRSAMGRNSGGVKK